MPKKTTYMTSFQRELYNRLLKKKKPQEDEYIWVTDVSDTTIPEESKLEKINRAEVEISETYSPEISEPRIKVEKIEDLSTKDIEFRMEYSKPLGTEIDLQRYDLMNDKMIKGIKINEKGRFIVDLEDNLKNSDSGNIEYKNDGIPMYKLPSNNKKSSLVNFINNLDSCRNDLSFLKRVPYNYQCQSSGEDLKSQSETRERDEENLREIALALDSKNN